jgi:uncharacterized protein (TIGR01319 family)
VNPIQVLTIEVGSTITKVNGFERDEAGGLRHLAQGFAATSVARGDVGIGVAEAMADLRSRCQGDLDQAETFVNSSAAGGLRMTVHGLTYGMTARAAREASLGAGAIVKQVTAGALGPDQLEEIRELRPNIILLAGGVDHGETATVLANAERLAGLDLGVPVLYAGNIALRKPIQRLFETAGVELLIADNVFPEVDVLNVEPLRRLIHEVFSRHIVHAPGMAALAAMTRWGILPTPGAVLRGAELFAEVAGDCLVFDVGGATTDVHSVTDGSREFRDLLVDPEPRAKRTVEGDLGVFINAANIVELSREPGMAERLPELQALPASEREREFTRWLCQRAVEAGVRRHAGTLADLYTPTGRKRIVRGKDLSAVRWVIATGGALTRVAGGADSLRKLCTGPGKYLLPPPEARILLDRDYLFSALGTLAQACPDEVKTTFGRWARSH